MIFYKIIKYFQEYRQINITLILEGSVKLYMKNNNTLIKEEASNYKKGDIIIFDDEYILEN